MYNTYCIDKMSAVYFLKNHEGEYVLTDVLSILDHLDTNNTLSLVMKTCTMGKPLSDEIMCNIERDISGYDNCSLRLTIGSYSAVCVNHETVVIRILEYLKSR